MLEIKVNGDSVRVAKRGKMADLSLDYLKAIMSIIESFAMDINVPQTDVLTMFYHEILEIYNDNDAIIKEV